MKLNKIFTFAALATTMFFAVSCSDDDNDYTPAEKPTGAQVFFPKGTATEVSPALDATSFSIPVRRANVTGAIDVPLTVTGDENTIYTVPTSVSFNDGDSISAIVIDYDPTLIEYGRYDTLTIAINPEMTTPYGNSEIQLIAGVTAWVDYGVAQYREDLVTHWFGVENVVYNVPIQKNIVKEGYYRLVNPYGEAYPYNEDGDYDPDALSYMVINATDPDWVYVEDCETTMDWTYGAFYMCGYAYYYIINGYDLEVVKANKPELFGTLKDGVITMPAGSILISMADYQNGGLYFANDNGLFAVALPGYAIADYSVAVSYAGTFTDASNNVFAVGYLTQSEDVKTVKAAVVSASDNANAVADAIAAGTLQAVDVTAGRIEVPIAEGLTGKLQLVVVAVDGTEAKAVGSATFEYYGGGVSPWVEVGTGTYTYTAFFCDFDEDDNPIPYEDGPLTIFKNNDDPTLYKVTDWGYGADFLFTWDGEDGDGVTVPTSYTGYTDNQYGYGPIYVSDAPTWSEGYYTYDMFPCSYDAETSTFSFVVAYWDMVDPADAWGLNEETLQVTWGDAAPAAARAAKAKNLQVKSKKTASNLSAKARKSPFTDGKKTTVKSVKTLKPLTGTPVLVK